jgi:hypothetical protein
MIGVIDPARENIVSEGAAAQLKPNEEAGPCRLKELKLDRSSGFLLHHDRPRPDLAATDDVADSNLDHVAPAQLAVDGEVEQRPVAQPALVIKPKAYGPDLAGLQSSFGTDDPPSVPGLPLVSRRIVF